MHIHFAREFPSFVLSNTNSPAPGLTTFRALSNTTKKPLTSSKMVVGYPAGLGRELPRTADQFNTPLWLWSANPTSIAIAAIGKSASQEAPVLSGYAPAEPTDTGQLQRMHGTLGIKRHQPRHTRVPSIKAMLEPRMTIQPPL